MFRRSRLHDGTFLICAQRGVGAQNASSACTWLIAEGVKALANLGVSGGLQEGLRPGDLVLADRVIEKGMSGETVAFEPDRICTDLAHAAFMRKGMSVHRGAIYSAQQGLLTVEEKKSLRSRSLALVVDMESAAVARAAVEAGLPFFVLRAVCDPADWSVDQDLFSCLGQDGRVRLLLLLEKIGRRPSLLRGLLRTRRDFLLALNNLSRAWRIQIRIDMPKRLLSR